MIKSKYQNKNQFDELGEDYFNIPGGHVYLYYARRKVELLSHLIDANFSVLDVGCGAGEHAKLLEKHCKAVSGVDASENMIKAANNNFINGFAVKADSSHLPFKNSSFDMVFTSSLLHHVNDPLLVNKTICEMARVSKKTVCILEFNSFNPFVKYLLFKLCPYDAGDERIPPKKEVVRSMVNNSLKITNVKHIFFMPMYMPKFLIPIFSRMEIFLEKIIPFLSIEILYISEHQEIVSK
ncbi:Ubiquinone/menaquinone biosynthesis C-methyltransferase UbiE [uncultured archaeon]|nr:Ubiquinone/menaquinone biosynthesis C-methyltransferase UbiE [uncultured archaeon]